MGGVPPDPVHFLLVRDPKYYTYLRTLLPLDGLNSCSNFLSTTQDRDTRDHLLPLLLPSVR